MLFFPPRALSCQTRMQVSGMRLYQGRKGHRQQRMYLEKTKMIDVSMSCLVVVLDDFVRCLECHFKFNLKYLIKWPRSRLCR